jgi:hypothetical protein
MVGLESSLAGHGELAGEEKGRREGRSRGDVLLAASCGEEEGGKHYWLRRGSRVPSKELQKGLGPLDCCLCEVEERKEKREKRKEEREEKKREKEKGNFFEV